MPITKIHAGLYRADSTCHTWLIVRGDTAIAIDPGDGRWMDELARIGVRRLEWVLLTHTQREHCSGVYRLDRTTTKLAAPSVERHLVQDVEAFWRYRQVHINYNQVDDFAALPRSAAVDCELRDFDSFTWRDVTLNILPAPGSSPGAIALVHGRDAFVGDMIQAPACVPRIDRLQYGYGDTTGAVLLVHSLHHLMTHQPARLFPANGPVIEEPAAACAALADKLRVFCRELGYTAPIEPRPQFIELHENLLAFTQSSCAWYVLHDGQGAALAIDVGYPTGQMYVPSLVGYYTRFLPGAIETLRETHGIKRIEVVVPTHYHDDHIIGVPWLQQHHGSKVWCYDRIAPILGEPTRFNMPCLIHQALPIDRAIADRETFEWRGIRMQMHNLPGQTDLHSGISFDLGGKRYLAMGDCGHIREGKHVHGHIIFANRVNGANHLKVAERMLEIAPEVLLHGHNRRVEDGRPRPDTPVTEQDLRDYVESAQRLDRVLHDMVVDDAGRRCRADWVRMEPYRVWLKPGESGDVEVIAENTGERPIDVQLNLIVPTGVTADPPSAVASIPAGGVHRSAHRLAMGERPAASPSILCINVTLDQQPLGWIGHGQIWHEGISR